MDYEMFIDDHMDWEYECFREQTGHITNFDLKEAERYQKAIDLYSKISPDTKLVIGEGYKWEYLKGLYMLSTFQDLSEFWAIYDELEKV